MKELKEIWIDIKTYEGLYQISNMGQVKSLEKKVDNHKRTRPEYVFKPRTTIWGYLFVTLSKNDKRKSFPIHRLVAIHFVENKEFKKMVNHIDGNKKNNMSDNLEWVSNRENICHHKNGKLKNRKYVGVHWDNKNKKWRATIYHNGKNKNLGRFTSEEEAYSARVKYEIENNISNKYS